MLNIPLEDAAIASFFKLDCEEFPSIPEGYRCCLASNKVAVAWCWEVLGAGYNPPLCEAIAGYDSYIEKLAERASTVVLLEGAEIAAAVSMYANDESNRTAYVSQFAVEANHRRKGLGALMLSIADVFSRSKGMTSIRLEVNEDNLAAQSLYKKNGYSLESNSGHGSVYMFKDLGSL